jgi:Holliday junction resolvase RusA-like endonuclease
MSSKQIHLTNLPIPVSANHMHAYRRGRVTRSKAYQTWMLECRCRVGAYPGKVVGVVSVQLTITGGAGWRANRDLDNIIKPTIDLLRYLHVIEEDHTGIVRQITATFLPGTGAPATMTVTVTPQGEDV